MGGKRRALGRASEDDDKSLGLRLVVNHFCLRSSSLASGSLTFSQGLWTLGYSRTLDVKQRPRECPRPGLRARVTKVRPKSFSLGLCAHRPARATTNSLRSMETVSRLVTPLAPSGSLWSAV